MLNQVTGETLVFNCYFNEHIRKTALVTRRRVGAMSGEYSPNPLGYTRAAMSHSMRCDSEKRS